MNELKYKVVPKAPRLKSQINVTGIESPQINPSMKIKAKVTYQEIKEESVS